MDQVPYEVPGDLEVAIAGLRGLLKRRYHKAFGNVTPEDVLQMTSSTGDGKGS